MKKFLWESKINRNEKTLDSLSKQGQLVHGIVTIDGKIVDGNRRAMLLNKICKNSKKYPLTEHESQRFFVAAILDAEGTEKDLVKLETYYQMGQDEKLDYNHY